jgi:eukaryotic-like serine/threonine-protein kinase
MVGKCIGNYVIERVLAHGGMGAVYVARDRSLGRQAAVKFVGQGSECEADTARRFLEEARITASLQHPNIVTIFDYGELEGRLYYVMELLAGSDLAVLMRSKKRFDIEQVRNCLDQICSGLHAAHAIGIVHRDLKPGNIFVLEGEPLRIKLMDFGVAKILVIDEDRTCRGQIVGTPLYMSPEQASGQVDRISPRSDIYSLGIIVYEMLTGARIFDDPSPIVLLMMHIRDPVPRIRALAPDMPSGIAELIESCLAKDPRQRPQSVLEVAARFAEAVSAASVNPHGNSARARLIENGFVPQSNRLLPGAPDTTVGFAPDVEAPTSAAPAARTLCLDENDRATLNRLWLKMQQSGDFPAFVQDANDAPRGFGIESSNSASEFGESVLKDFALTAKLLRIINSAYSNRFGGKVDSVQHAIVILGIDRVRSIALSISLFENQGSDAQSLRVSESAISSLISGEIAQQFAPYAHVSDAEQAMICGMFRNFGRHLAIVYLPVLYDRILELSQSEGLSLDFASERVLGLSLRKLGLGVGERWCLPKPILGVMSNIPGMSGRWAHEEDRIVELAEFSNELCEIVASESEQTRPLAIADLLSRHNALLTIDPNTMAQLLQSVQESFERRYSSLLGLDSTKSSFSRNVVALVSVPESHVRTTDHQIIEAQSELTRVTAEKTAT